jgi:hypothetical protein
MGEIDDPGIWGLLPGAATVLLGIAAITAGLKLLGYIHVDIGDPRELPPLG